MNTTETTNSTNHTQDDKGIYAFYALFGICYGLLVCAISILTICILARCTKLTRQIRLMAIHMTATNLAFGFLFLFGITYRFLNNGSSCSAITRTTALPFVLFNIFLTAAGFDRLFSLIYSIKYTLWSKNQNTSVMIASLYVIGICLHLPHIPPYLRFSCREDKNLFTYGGYWSFISSICILITCDVAIYFYIGVIATKTKASIHSIKKNDYSKFSFATLKTFVLSIVSIVLMGPFVINVTIRLLYFDKVLPDIIIPDVL